jgi:hypothetical protein
MTISGVCAMFISATGWGTNPSLNYIDLRHFYPGHLQHPLIGVSCLTLSASRDAEMSVDCTKYGGPQLQCDSPKSFNLNRQISISSVILKTRCARQSIAKMNHKCYECFDSFETSKDWRGLHSFLAQYRGISIETDQNVLHRVCNSTGILRC